MGQSSRVAEQGELAALLSVFSSLLSFLYSVLSEISAPQISLLIISRLKKPINSHQGMFIMDIK